MAAVDPRASSWRRLLREPIVVFLVLGVGVFALEKVGGGLDPEQRRIEITAADVERLRELWAVQSLRPPSDQELEALIEDAVEEEMLVREARRLGLDRDDTIVRRRLAQKMSFLIQDTAEVGAPTESELSRFFAENQERYVEPARVTFAHVFFSSERRGDSPETAAEAALAELRGGTEAVAWRRLGDPFLLNREYAERSQREIAELFGRPFAASLFELEPGGWQGPLGSAYGLHLVRVVQRSEERRLSLDESRPRVIEDYRSERRRRANEEELARLRRRYQVIVERPDSSATPAASVEAESRASESTAATAAPVAIEP